MKPKIRAIINWTIIFILAIAYIYKFGGPSILRLYVGSGIGNCQNQPIFCIAPGEEVLRHEVDKDYLSQLKLQKFPELELYLPKELKGVLGESSRTYYKKRPWKTGTSVAYILFEKPNYFVGLFPQLAKQGVKDDYTFVTRTMSAKFDAINNITDAFFVIMKSIFTPDLGDQKNTKIVRFISRDKRGFITYNLSASGNYFDCNILDLQQNYFKLYIKDKAAMLDLDKVLSIISTINKIPAQQ